jgi:hypothetical protein
MRQTHLSVAGIYQAHRTTSHAGRKAEAFRRGRRGEGIPSGTDYRVWRVDAPRGHVWRLIQWASPVSQSALGWIVRLNEPEQRFTYVSNSRIVRSSDVVRMQLPSGALQLLSIQADSA